MRMMALDVGVKRIGIALSDPLMITSQGLETYYRKTLAEDLSHYQRIIKDYQVNRLIVGLPVDLYGNPGKKADEIKEYIDRIKPDLGIPVEFYDERYTTKIAENIMLSANEKRSKRRQSIDMLAAQIILRDYMEHMKHEQSDH